MIKAKKKKYVKNAVIGSGVAISALAVAGVVYANTDPLGTGKNVENNVTSRANLAKVELKIIPKNAFLSNTDTNINKENQKSEDERKKTILVFVNNSKTSKKEIVKKVEFYSSSDEELQIQIQNLIPNGFIIDEEVYPANQPILAKLGGTEEDEENRIKVVPERQNAVDTTFIFYTTGEKESEQNEVGKSVVANEKVKNNFDLVSIVPEGFKLVDAQDLSFSIGVTNRFNVVKKVRQVTTVIVFKDGDEQIENAIELKNEENSPIKLAKHLPTGYKLAKDQAPEIAAVDGQVEIQVVPVAQKITTVIRFLKNSKNNNSSSAIVVSSHTIVTEDGEDVDYRTYLPDNYELDDNQPEPDIQLGETNNIYIKEIKKKITTLIRIVTRDGQDVTTPISVQSLEGDPIAFDQTWIPNGFKLQNEGKPVIKPGETNSIIVVPLENEVTTIIKFNWNNRPVSKPIEIVGEKDSQVDIKRYIPEGFEISKDETKPTLVTLANEEITFNLSKLSVVTTFKFVDNATNQQVGKIRQLLTTVDDSRISTEKINNLIPAGYELLNKGQAIAIAAGQENEIRIQKILITFTTTVEFYDSQTNQTIGQRYSFETQDERQSIDWESKIPQDYHIVNVNQKITIGTHNRIPLAKNKRVFTYSIRFLEGSKLVFAKDGEYFEDSTPSISEFIPSGYKLADVSLTTSFPQNGSQDYQVVKIVDKPKPVVNEPDPVDNRDLPSPSEIINARQGAYVNIYNLNIPSKPSSIPSVSNSPSGIPAEVIADRRRRIQDLVKFANSNLPITVENLKDIYREKYEESPIHVEQLVRYLTGQWKLGREISKEELREHFRMAANAAAAAFESELAAGRIPIFETTCSPWGCNTGPIYGYLNKEDNPVLSRYISYNKQHIFGNDEEWERNPQEILEGRYRGWGKYDQSDQYPELVPSRERYKVTYTPDGRRVTNDDGLRVWAYRPDENNKFAQKNKTPRSMLEVDASNKKGYVKFLKFLQDHPEVTTVRVTNIGKTTKNEDLRNLLEQLPSGIAAVELFFSTRDTSASAGLKDKVLESAGLYTTLPNNDVFGAKRWGIDPITFKNTKFVHATGRTLLTFEGRSNEPVAESIIFDTIRPSKYRTFQDIVDGFDIVLHKKADFRIFNGTWGDGSWPRYVDFSLNPGIKSFKGLNLYERVFRGLTLHSDDEIWELPMKEIVPGQFKALVVDGPERAQLDFDNDSTDTLYLSGDPNEIGNNFGIHLYGLFEAGANTFRRVIVDSQRAKEFIEGTQAWSTFGNRLGGSVQIKNR
ncbi:putative immunoglobulin-blocking virulence protein [Mycoplasma nasistruthionis]|uniref:Putative immunoglobulin-blocking virulence protein n=1 Tax=Mycoplasma nasistruthionis TaxID=353852 RepID=A0A4Y6I5X2_9MOLU|nr:putative immunoglobulin-blocking virulence protein [Mycoplasma nasistruthionis]QDF65024.1 putative immunoglobulin-blocking virulence protein [Mycoplasma nasistruthionis]